MDEIINQSVALATTLCLPPVLFWLQSSVNSEQNFESSTSIRSAMWFIFVIFSQSISLPSNSEQKIVTLSNLAQF